MAAACLNGMALNHGPKATDGMRQAMVRPVLSLLLGRQTRTKMSSENSSQPISRTGVSRVQRPGASTIRQTETSVEGTRIMAKSDGHGHQRGPTARLASSCPPGVALGNLPRYC